jgi:hypothetical protein
VLLEEGVTLRGSPEASCRAFASILAEYRATFEEAWGPVALQEEEWTVRVRAGGAADSAGHSGVTYHHSRVVDVAEDALETFPHELRHVQLDGARTTTTAGATASRRGRNRCSAWTSGRTSAARGSPSQPTVWEGAATATEA